MPEQLGRNIAARSLAACDQRQMVDNIANSQLADMTAGTIKGRALGTGAGIPVDLTGTNAGKIISGDTITTLGSAATTLTVSSLDGNANGDFRFDFELNVVQAACTVAFRINGLETNMKAYSAQWSTGAGVHTNLRFGAAAGADKQFANGDKLYGYGTIRAKSGRIRFIEFVAFSDQATDDKYEVTGIWTDTTTNITSLDFNAGVASGLGTGSFLRVTRLNTSN